MDRLFLVITGNCNARCRLCHYWKQEEKRHLPLDFIGDRVEPLIHRYDIRLVILTGGEPTLHPRLPEIAGILKQAGAQVSLVTNGSGLEPRFHQLAGNLDGYMFSLDAADPVLYKKIRGLDNFDSLIQWPQQIRRRSPHAQVAFLCLLQKENVADLVNIYRLAESLPIDALIFNLPELKPHCFGHNDEMPEEDRESALLSPEEIRLLTRNLQEIQTLDQGRGLLLQGSLFFHKCVLHFEALAQGRNDSHGFNDPDITCRIPFDSVVIDENQRVHPCFYLPGSAPLETGSDDPLNSDVLMALRREITEDKAFREKHCSFCMQFQG